MAPQIGKVLDNHENDGIFLERLNERIALLNKQNIESMSSECICTFVCFCWLCKNIIRVKIENNKVSL